MSNDDVMKHFDKLSSDEQAKKVADRTREDTEKAERKVANDRVHKIYQAVVEPKIASLKSDLAARGVALEKMQSISFDDASLHRNRVSFHLCNVGEESLHGRARTQEYSLSLRDNGEVLASRTVVTRGSAEDLRTKIGTVSVDEITDAYVGKLVTLAITEWFEVKDKPVPKQRY